jgi:hypothetical protein
MDFQSIKQLIGRRHLQPGRAMLAALLLAALVVAIVAGSALAASANLVKNGSFEKDTNGDGIPNKWAALGSSSLDKRVCNQSYAGACSFKMVGESVNKFLVQELAISGDAGDEFKLSAWTKGKDIDTTGNAQVIVYFNHTGGGTSEWSFDIPDGTSPWTLRQVPATAGSNYDSISIAIYNSIVSGKMWVDKVKVVAIP